MKGFERVSTGSSFDLCFGNACPRRLRWARRELKIPKENGEIAP